MTKLIYAKAILSVGHSAPGMGRPMLHGHSYEIWAYEPAHGQSAEDLQARLKAACESIDHLNLDEVWGPNNGTMENIADHLHKLMPTIEKFNVCRPVEGLGCEAKYLLKS